MLTSRSCVRIKLAAFRLYPLSRRTICWSITILAFITCSRESSILIDYASPYFPIRCEHLGINRYPFPKYVQYSFKYFYENFLRTYYGTFWVLKRGSKMENIATTYVSEAFVQKTLQLHIPLWIPPMLRFCPSWWENGIGWQQLNSWWERLNGNNRIAG